MSFSKAAVKVSWSARRYKYKLLIVFFLALSQLDQSACRCPADKAAILVATHKILVGEYRILRIHVLRLMSGLDGLSRLPPLRLKSEAELENQSTPGTTTTGTTPKKEDVELEEKPAADAPPTITTFLSTEGETPPPIVISPEDDTPPPLPSVASVKDGLTDPLTPPPRLASLPQPRATSPRLIVSPPATPTPVSGDLILPLMIYAVVRANPQHLVSHLLFTQRFRNQSFGGEESYCLVNLMAVADFLENVDLKALGLGESEKTVTRCVSPSGYPRTTITQLDQQPKHRQSHTYTRRTSGDVSSFSDNASRSIRAPSRPCRTAGRCDCRLRE